MKNNQIKKTIQSFAGLLVLLSGPIGVSAQTVSTWGGGSDISIDSAAPEAWDGAIPNQVGDIGTINSGNVIVTGAFNWLGTLNVNSGATLDLSPGSNIQEWADVRLNGGRIGSTVEARTFGNANSNIELIGNDNVIFYERGSIGNANIQIDASLTGSGGFIKQGLGAVRLRNTNNSFEGDLRIEEGRLMLWENATIPNTTLDMAGGEFWYWPDADGRVEVGGLKGSTDLTLNWTISPAPTMVASEFVVGGNNQDTVYSGDLRIQVGRGDGSGDDVAFVKVGTGTLTMTGVSNHPGETLVNEGTMIINGQNIGGGAITIKNGATLGGGGLIANDIIFESGANFQFSITDTLIIDDANVVVDLGDLGIMNITNLNPEDVAEGDIYILITGDANYDFSQMANLGVENAVGIGNGLSAYFIEGSGLQLAIIPEASSIWISFVALISVVAMRHRRVGSK